MVVNYDSNANVKHLHVEEDSWHQNLCSMFAATYLYLSIWTISLKARLQCEGHSQTRDGQNFGSIIKMVCNVQQAILRFKVLFEPSLDLHPDNVFDNHHS